MKKISLFLLTTIICFSISLLLLAKKYEGKEKFSSNNPLVFLDFNDQDIAKNMLDDQYGVWDGDPEDQEASIKTKFKKDSSLHKKGYNLQIDYDVESAKPAFNGIWCKLKTLDLSKFEAVSITIKGDKRKGYSKLFKIEIKSDKHKIEGIVDNISDDWQKKIIYFDDCDGDVEEINLKMIKEFVIVFEDWRMTKKTGRYYIDDISFIPKKNASVKYSDIVK